MTLTGRVITCDYGRQFYSNTICNKDVIEGVLAIRRRTGYGGM